MTTELELASLADRVEGLASALERMRDILRKMQPAMNVMAREVFDDIIRDQIDLPLAAYGKGVRHDPQVVR